MLGQYKMESIKFSQSYLLFQQEGYLIRSCLTIGLTELRKAGVHNKGAFYSSLFNITVGLERLLKVIVIMHHMLKNGLRVPSRKQLRKYGHNIIELYDKCASVALEYRSQLPKRSSFDEINQELISLYNSFAQNTRYYNLDSLSSAQRAKDPLEHWSKIILSILATDVSDKQINKILNQACLIGSAIEDHASIIFQDLNKKPLTAFDVVALPRLHEQAVKFAVLRIMKIISPIRDLISDISHEVCRLNVESPPFPQMQEFLEWVSDDRNYVLRKKKWF